MDQIAADRITEIEAQLEDAYIKIDLLQESLDERDEEFRAAKAQIAGLLNDRRFPDMGAA